MTWPPQIGDPLPRASEAWYEPVKLEDWVLGPRGHGEEWQRVFHVGLADRERVWQAIVAAAANARIFRVRNVGAHGVVCGIQVELTIGERSARVRMSWHYANKEAAPRLVTAYVNL
jgi:hypothetical protein